MALEAQIDIGAGGAGVAAASQTGGWDVARGEDRAMLQAAAALQRELGKPLARFYWPDFFLSAGLGYGALALAIAGVHPLVTAAAVVVAILALYRAALFIHELTHLRSGALPGFRIAWNLVLGIPMMVPSFLYEGVHNVHHLRTKYGTPEDPEYLALARMSPWSLPVFLLISVLAPVALLLRFGLLGPLSFVIPPLRRFVVESCSALEINMEFKRPAPTGSFRRDWLVQEVATSVWTIGLFALTVAGTVPLRAYLFYLGTLSGVALLNQVRTLVAHVWESEGETMTITAQYLDSVNVPPPGILPLLWAPVGLRYHALHHLLPNMPYHALEEAHRRLSTTLGARSAYHGANYRGITWLLIRMIREPAHRTG